MNLKPQTVNKLRKLVRNYNNKINRVKINKPEISDTAREKKYKNSFKRYKLTCRL